MDFVDNLNFVKKKLVNYFQWDHLTQLHFIIYGINPQYSNLTNI